MAISMQLFPQAACQYIDCDWETQGSDALAQVKWHVGETGHEVVMDRISRSIYRGTERPSRKKASA